MHYFDGFILSMSIPSETSILWYCNIVITHTKCCLKKLVDRVYHLLQETDLNYYYCMKF